MMILTDTLFKKIMSIVVGCAMGCVAFGTIKVPYVNEEHSELPENYCTNKLGVSDVTLHVLYGWGLRPDGELRMPIKRVRPSHEILGNALNPVTPVVRAQFAPPGPCAPKKVHERRELGKGTLALLDFSKQVRSLHRKKGVNALLEMKKGIDKTRKRQVRFGEKIKTVVEHGYSLRNKVRS